MMRFYLIGCLILGLAGCNGLVPSKVQYAEYPKTAIGKASSDESGYLFRQRRSVIMVSYNKNKETYEATAVPYELTADGSYNTLYRVWGNDDRSSTTRLKVSYIDNTRLIDTLEVTTKDNIADTISKIGEVAVAAVPLVAAVVKGPPPKEAEPFKTTMIDPDLAGIGQWTRDPNNKGYCVRIRDIVKESPLTLQQYVTDRLGKWQGTFPVTACDSGIVEVAWPCNDQSIKIQFSSRITFGDAHNVLPVSLPSSGILKMNSICGASVTEAEKQDRQDLLEYLQKTMKLANGVSAAWKKATAETEEEKK